MIDVYDNITVVTAWLTLLDSWLPSINLPLDCQCWLWAFFFRSCPWRIFLRWRWQWCFRWDTGFICISIWDRVWRWHSTWTRSQKHWWQFGTQRRRDYPISSCTGCCRTGFGGCTNDWGLSNGNTSQFWNQRRWRGQKFWWTTVWGERTRWGIISKCRWWSTGWRQHSWAGWDVSSPRHKRWPNQDPETNWKQTRGELHKQ